MYVIHFVYAMNVMYVVYSVFMYVYLLFEGVFGNERPTSSDRKEGGPLLLAGAVSPGHSFHRTEWT